MKARALPFLLISVLGCAQERAAAPLEVGIRYELLLVAEGPRDVMPEVAQRVAPITDSATYWLEADSIKSDSLFGKYGGENPHFWVPFWAGTRSSYDFIAVPSDSGWHFDMALRVMDAGLDLTVTNQGVPVRGIWSNRSDFPKGGRFEIRVPGA